MKKNLYFTFSIGLSKTFFRVQVVVATKCDPFFRS